jgi:hypothetical protein
LLLRNKATASDFIYSYSKWHNRWKMKGTIPALYWRHWTLNPWFELTRLENLSRVLAHPPRKNDHNASSQRHKRVIGSPWSLSPKYTQNEILKNRTRCNCAWDPSPNPFFITKTYSQNRHLTTVYSYLYRSYNNLSFFDGQLHSGRY